MVYPRHQTSRRRSISRDPNDSHPDLDARPLAPRNPERDLRPFEIREPGRGRGHTAYATGGYPSNGPALGHRYDPTAPAPGSTARPRPDRVVDRDDRGRRERSQSRGTSLDPNFRHHGQSVGRSSIAFPSEYSSVDEPAGHHPRGPAADRVPYPFQEDVPHRHTGRSPFVSAHSELRLNGRHPPARSVGGRQPRSYLDDLALHQSYLPEEPVPHPFTFDPVSAARGQYHPRRGGTTSNGRSTATGATQTMTESGRRPSRAPPAYCPTIGRPGQPRPYPAVQSRDPLAPTRAPRYTGSGRSSDNLGPPPPYHPLNYPRPSESSSDSTSVSVHTVSPRPRAPPSVRGILRPRSGAEPRAPAGTRERRVSWTRPRDDLQRQAQEREALRRSGEDVHPPARPTVPFVDPTPPVPPPPSPRWYSLRARRWSAPTQR